ncbi:MAG TPA: peptide chain release factor N(5)-glutamine methyltransferase, partial [Lachnospiraceae bacterium]|nr:peptide chain release factor N(5)-glutamine methyltransferase [Lachnospiraceae bacterium]
MAYTYREVYQEGTAMLDFLPDARIDARRLLEHVCGTTVQTLLADPDRPVSPGEYEKYLELISRRQQREPLAYIVGEQEFMGLPFRVSPHVLIPGQDTENLVEEAMRELTDGSRILDLCTGSGCILLSLLQYSNSNSGVGTDLSREA